MYRGRSEVPALEMDTRTLTQSTVVAAAPSLGEVLPTPTDRWHRLVLDDGEWDFQDISTWDHQPCHPMFRMLAMSSGRRFIAVNPLQDWCLRTSTRPVAFSSCTVGVMQRLLRHFRSSIINDPHRLKAAVELTIPTLAVGPPAMQERWLAALLTSGHGVE